MFSKVQNHCNVFVNFNSSARIRWPMTLGVIPCGLTTMRVSMASLFCKSFAMS